MRLETSLLDPPHAPRNLSLWNCHPAPQPSPATKALGLPPCPPGQLRWVPPHPTGHPSKNIIVLQVAKFAPSLGPCPYHLPPRHRSPTALPQPSPCLKAPVAPVGTPPPHKENIIVLLGPVPLPPAPPEPKPLDPPSRALVPPPTLPLFWNCHPAPTPGLSWLWFSWYSKQTFNLETKQLISVAPVTTPDTESSLFP